MKNILLLLIVALFLAAGLASCTDYQFPAEVGPQPGDSVRFNADIIPIFNLSCNGSGCHAPGGISPDLSPANAYSNLITFGHVDTDFPEQSNLYVKVHSGSMKQFAKTNDAEKILIWIQQGALNN